MNSSAADTVLGEWRGQSWMILAGLVAGSVAAIMAAMTIVSLVVPVEGGSAAWVIGVLFYAPVAYALGRLTVGCLRAGVTISRTTVVVRNPWRTVAVPVAQATSFQATSYGSGNAAVMLRVNTIGSWGAAKRPVILFATYRGGFIWSAARRATRLEPVAVEMNDALTRAQTSPGHP